MELATAFFTTLTKTTPKLAQALAVAISVVIFSPDYVSAQLGLQLFLDVNREWVGFALIVFASIAITPAPLAVGKETWDFLTARYKLCKLIENLTTDEKAVLLVFISARSRSHLFSTREFDDIIGVFSELSDKSLIRKITRRTHGVNQGYVYNISDYAYTYLIKRAHLVAP